jgi:hypothetical protein
MMMSNTSTSSLLSPLAGAQPSKTMVAVVTPDEKPQQQQPQQQQVIKKLTYFWSEKT